MAKPLPSTDELARYVTPRAFAQGLTPKTLQRVIALRRVGTNWPTICLGGLNLPRSLVEPTYNKLPAHLR